MTVISTQEFAANQNKYFDMAIDQDVCIKRGRNMFRLMPSIIDETKVKQQNGQRKYKQPDEDFYRAISMDEFIEKALVRIEKIDKMYAKR